MPQAARTPASPAAEPSEARRARLLARQAAASEDAKRSFLRMVSHELRTPLNAIIGFAEIISAELYGPLGQPQYRQYAEHIHQSGLRLLGLVNQVLEIARLEGKVVDLELRPASPDEAIDDACSLLSAEIGGRRLTIAVEDEGALPLVLADAPGLRTMVFNLLQNAILWSPHGGTIAICARRDGANVELEIADHGPGLDPQEIPRLLRPFEQGQSALTRTTQGAGLGLPIVHLLSQAMGGGLRLRSAPGEGLTATIVLPSA